MAISLLSLEVARVNLRNMQMECRRAGYVETAAHLASAVAAVVRAADAYREPSPILEDLTEPGGIKESDDV